MDNEKSVRFFLASNTTEGFYSLYQGFVSPGPDCFFWVIKGGPGCGKSTFMKKIGAAAEARGAGVEYIHCSGDPDSLDAVYIPALGVAYADGTSPHVMEAVYPGACSSYLDLGRFYDIPGLRSSTSGIVELNTRYKAMYARAYSFLRAAGAASPKRIAAERFPDVCELIKKRADGVASRELDSIRGRHGTVSRRFLSSFTYKGAYCFPETVDAACDRIYSLDNSLGLAAVFLSSIAHAASGRGLDTVLCPDPLLPERLEAVFVPQQRLGFIAAPADKGIKKRDSDRHLRLDAMVDTQLLHTLRPEIRSETRLFDSLTEKGKASLHSAKLFHDELEKFYVNHIDFDGLDQEAEKHIAGL